MDPHKVSAPSADQFLFPVYDALTFLDENGDPKPMLATSWDAKDDPPSVTFHLRKGLKFPSGTAFDAAAVQANLQRAMNKDVSLVAADIAPVTSVDVVDDLTVRVNTAEPYPELPIVLADRAGMMIDPAAFNSPDLAEKGAGIGPYRLESHVPGSKIEYVKTENYWNPEIQTVARISMLVIQDNAARLNAVLSGEADLTEIAGDQYSQAKSADLQIVSGPVLQSERLAFNTAKSEFGKKAVRQALNWAIDRKTIVSSLMPATCTANNQFGPPGTVMHSDDIPASLYKYDPAKAKKLLADAGLPNGFSFEALVVNDVHYLQYAQVLQQEFKAIGVDMKLTPVDGKDIINAFYKDKRGDALISGAIASGAPSSWAQLAYSRTGFRNPGGTTTDEIEQLTQDVQRISDPKKLKEAWNKLEADVADYAFGAIICNRTLTDAANHQVTGLKIYLASQRQLRGVGLKKQ